MNTRDDAIEIRSRRCDAETMPVRPDKHCVDRKAPQIAGSLAILRDDGRIDGVEPPPRAGGQRRDEPWLRQQREAVADAIVEPRPVAEPRLLGARSGGRRGRAMQPRT